MNGFFGADTGALRDYAQRVQTGSGRLLELRSSLATQVGSVEWIGPDADAFRSDFSSRISALFDQIGGDLDRRRADLETHAEEQDEASGVDGGGGGGDRSFGDLLGDLLSNPLTAVGSTIASVAGAGGALWKMFKQSRNLMNLRTAMNTLGDAAQSAQTFLRGGMVDDAAGFLGKLGGVGRFLGGAGGVLGIAGGLSVVSGAGGLAVALGAGAALGPVGLGVVAVAGVGAGLWAAGNAIYDNWDSITSFAGDVGGHVSDFVSDAGDVVGGAVDAVSGFVGGLF